MSKFIPKFRKGQDYEDDYSFNRSTGAKRKGVKNESAEVRSKKLRYYEQELEDDTYYESDVVPRQHIR